MKPVRLVTKKQVSEALSKDLDGFPGLLRRWGNTILTTVLVAASVVMLVRWRLASAEQARLALLNSLTNARSYVIQLHSENLPMMTPQYLASVRSEVTSRANAEISSVLNTTNDPKLKSEALITRGDLYWQLANFPDLPGAATQPSLRSSEPREELLKKSADAYNEVLKSDAYAKQHDAMVSAHFGLAAIAENHGDWDTARRELELIANDSDALPVLSQQAKDQLEKLPEIETPLYLSPATQPSIEALLQNLPAINPAPTTLPSSPTTLPSPPR
jgi:hypothetical protein